MSVAPPSGTPERRRSLAATLSQPGSEPTRGEPPVQETDGGVADEAAPHHGPHSESGEGKHHRESGPEQEPAHVRNEASILLEAARQGRGRHRKRPVHQEPYCQHPHQARGFRCSESLGEVRSPEVADPVEHHAEAEDDGGRRRSNPFEGTRPPDDRLLHSQVVDVDEKRECDEGDRELPVVVR